MQMMSFFVSFLIFIPFGSFYYITVLVRTSSTLLKRSINSNILAVFLISKKMLSVFQHV